MLILSPFRTESSLDPLVQALEVLITSELNMNQAAPGVCGISSLFFPHPITLISVTMLLKKLSYFFQKLAGIREKQREGAWIGQEVVGGAAAAAAETQPTELVGGESFRSTRRLECLILERQASFFQLLSTKLSLVFQSSLSQSSSGQ